MLTPHKMQGVTLIEVMVALVIFSILMALGTGSFSNWIQNQQTRTATESILNGVQLARSEAVRANANAIFILCDTAGGGTGSSWDVLVASAPGVYSACVPTAGGAATGWDRVQMRSGLEGSRNALAAQTGGNAVAYNGLGRIVKIGGSGATALPPSATPVGQGLTQVDVWTLNGDRKLRVTIGSGGSARMCDPSPTLAQNDPRHCP